MKLTIYLFIFLFFGLTQATIAQTIQPQMILEQEVEIKTTAGQELYKNNLSFYIKDGKVKSTSNQQGMVMNTYYFSSTDIMYITIDMGGQIQKQQNNNALKNTNSEYSKIEVKYLDDTKLIAGTNCKKAIIKLKSKGSTEKRVVWYDPNTKLSFKYNFGVAGLELIEGLPIEYENTQMGMQMIHTVKKIDFSTNISKETFELPK
ncbi:hypothetical protein [Psychroserpens sp. S379A]|uniref:hypothetical protein n=1 Tax=Psychroserpens sp. S379A TaxID=3415137 RepID=UPI003C7D0813